MLLDNHIAFKEWAVVCAALVQGRHILILRKGGIHEGRDGFRVEHGEFWLFPTAFHQDASQLAPDAAPLLKQVLAEQPPPETIRIAQYAVVEQVFELRDEAALSKLAGQHILSDATVAQRFHYRQPGLFVLAVRVYNSPTATEFTDSPYFAGCKSWVELSREISTAGIVPALNDDEFDNRLKAIRAALQK